MNPLMLLMSSFGGGYGSFGSYGGGSCPEFGNIWQNAMMKTMMGMGMGPFGVGTFGGVQQYAGTYGGGEYTHGTGGCCGGNCGGARSFEAIEADYNEAYKNYERLNKLCEYADGKTLNKEELIKEREDLNEKFQKQVNSEEGADLKAIEEYQNKLEEIEIKLDAIELQQKEHADKLKEMKEQREAALKECNAISIEFATAKYQRAQQEKEAKFQRDNSGSWWNRSKINPKNWFNGKDNRANEAKCIRILYKKGPEAARAYAEKHGLVQKGETADETIKRITTELGNKSKSAQM